jgi:hypothetical protein
MTNGINERDLNSNNSSSMARITPCDRCVEGRRHPCCGTTSEQNFALGCRGVEDLSNERTDRAAGLNNRAFRAERSAGADCNRGGDRLQSGNARLNAAAVY